MRSIDQLKKRWPGKCVIGIRVLTPTGNTVEVETWLADDDVEPLLAVVMKQMRNGRKKVGR